MDIIFLMWHSIVCRAHLNFRKHHTSTNEHGIVVGDALRKGQLFGAHIYLKRPNWT